jgi:predicted small integral membrane protein
MSEKLEHIEEPIVIVEEDDAAPYRERSGFLPIQTNWFDRLFISVVFWVALSLFWFRFIEPLGLSIWISNVIVLAVAALVITKG